MHYFKHFAIILMLAVLALAPLSASAQTVVPDSTSRLNQRQVFSSGPVVSGAGFPYMVTRARVQSNGDNYFASFYCAGLGQGWAAAVQKRVGSVTTTLVNPQFTFPDGDTIRIDQTVSGTNPTTIDVQIKDLTAGLILEYFTLTDSEPSLQHPGTSLGQSAWPTVSYTAYNLDSVVPGDADTILHIGDSITANYQPSSQSPCDGERLAYASAGRSVTEINYGNPGTTTTDWLPGSSNLTAALAAASAQGAGTAEIMLGSNDAASGVSSSQFASNMQAIVGALASSGVSHIILLKVPWQGDPTRASFVQQYNSALSSISGASVGGGDPFAYFQAHQDQMRSDLLHPNEVGSIALGYIWAGQSPPGVTPPPTPPAPAVTPSGASLAPNNTLQLSVSGLASGVTVNGWSVVGTAPPGVTVSPAGLLTYGSALSAAQPLTLKVLLSDGSFVQGAVNLSVSQDTGTPDAAVPDTGTFNGTVGPMTENYLELLIKNFGIPAIIVSLAVSGWLLIRAWAKGVFKGA